jgi:SNF2 family DNA or RNA helicase
MLVVAPLSAFDAWATEVGDCFLPSEAPDVAAFTDHAPPDTEVLLVNYQRLATNYEQLATWVSDGDTLVLLDEAHRIKRGWDGAWGSACLNLAFLAKRRDILSGTPAPQAPSDLIALIDFLWPGEVLPHDALTSPPLPDAGHRVAQAIAPLFVRTRKSELGLRPPTRKVLQVPLDGIHKAIYESLRDRYAEQTQMSPSERVDFARMGQILMYMLEAATNPHLLASGSAEDDDPSFRHPPLEVPPDTPLWKLLQRYNQYETPRKFQLLAELVENNVRAGRKTLIWSNFVRNLRALELMFARYQPAVVHGGVPSEVTSPQAPRTREAELARFRQSDDCWVLFANPAAMSEGVSLHRECNDAVYLERTFNAGHYLQSIDRIHRLGLAESVETRVTLLVTAGTVDEIVDSRVREKAERLGHMLDDPDLSTMALPSEDDYGPALDSREDLKVLFAHLRGESTGLG